MVKPLQKSRDTDLEKQWRQWTEIVRLYACRRERRFAVDPSEYQVMHTQLLTVLREKRNNGQAHRAPQIGEAEQILAPWMSLESLAAANQEIVCQLLDRCRLAEQMLGGRFAAPKSWPWRGLILLGAGVLLALGALAIIPSNLDLALREPLPGLRPELSRLVGIVSATGLDLRLLVGGAVATFSTIALVWRSSGRV